MTTEPMGTVGDEPMRPEFPCSTAMTIRETIEGHVPDIIRASPSVAGSNTDASIVENPEASNEEIVRLPEIPQRRQRVQDEIVICEEREVM